MSSTGWIHFVNTQNMPVQLVNVNSTGARSNVEAEKNSRQVMAEKLLITPVLFLYSLTGPATYTFENLTSFVHPTVSLGCGMTVACTS
jgi:hypothetical protein